MVGVDSRTIIFDEKSCLRIERSDTNEDRDLTVLDGIVKAVFEQLVVRSKGTIELDDEFRIKRRVVLPARRGGVVNIQQVRPSGTASDGNWTSFAGS